VDVVLYGNTCGVCAVAFIATSRDFELLDWFTPWSRDVAMKATAQTPQVFPYSTTSTIAYQWLRDGAPIPGATAKTYQLTAAADASDHLIGVRVTLTRDGYNPLILTSPGSTVTFPTTVPPAVDNAAPEIGDVLGVTSGTCKLDGIDVQCDVFTDPAPLYQWFVGGVAVPAAQGGTSPTFTVPATALDKVIAVQVHYRANFYFSSPSVSADTAPVVAATP